MELTKHSRPAAVAGMFYPQDANELQHWIETALLRARTEAVPAKAMVVPHAGYIYSGQVAAVIYARLKNAVEPISRVVLIGPAHRVGFNGIAIPSVTGFATPLGNVPLDSDSMQLISQLPEVHVFDSAHAQEHCLEVQLPFLQVALQDFQLLPLLVGNTSPETVSEVLELIWGDKETIILISSDLSHFHDYATASELDRRTSQLIELGEEKALSAEMACGYLPLRGLLIAAKHHRLIAKTVALQNSGDTAGSRDRVVGYGAYVFEHAG